jgi:hypothetical protein
MELKLAYIALTMATNIFLIFIGFKAINQNITSHKWHKRILVIGLFLWQGFIYLIASIGILKSYDLPPLFVVFFILPSFVFTGIFLFRSRKKQWIKSIPEHWLVYFQSFRFFVELLFFFSLAQGIYNEQVTIEGYNFDLPFALSAPVLAFLVYHKKVLARRVVLLWNYLGLLILGSIIILFLTSIYTPELYGSQDTLLPLKAMAYPYLLIPSFFMPTAVFLHFLSILQIRTNMKHQ